MARTHLLGLNLGLLLVAACSDDGASSIDSGVATDSAALDSAVSDSAASDSTASDSAVTDSAVSDSAARDGGSTAGGAIRFVQNAAGEHEYGLHTALPASFGTGELTMEVWLRLDTAAAVGSTAGGEDQLRNWSDADNRPYSTGDWWYAGNFLLDGHNNGSGFERGTFSLQLYGGGRVRWLFGDGASAGPGGHWSVGAYPASSAATLLDDAWHRIAVVRRFDGGAGAMLELWVDDARIATETSTERTDMRDFWNAWPGFPSEQEGWFWGAEKQAAIGVLSQYEDYKGEMAELRFWDVARSPENLAEWDRAVRGDEPGLVGRFPFGEGSGDSACDVIDPSRCMRFTRWDDALWLGAGPVLRAP